jgi:hypothetical protein
MNHVKNYFIYSPGAENENGNTGVNSNEQKTGNAEKTPVRTEVKKKNKSFFRRIKEALQDWSNGDQRQQEFDDTRV